MQHISFNGENRERPMTARDENVSKHNAGQNSNTTCCVSLKEPGYTNAARGMFPLSNPSTHNEINLLA